MIYNLSCANPLSKFLEDYFVYCGENKTPYNGHFVDQLLNEFFFVVGGENDL